MSVDFSRLPAAEAQVLLASQIRCDGEAFAIVLDALNFYRCGAIFAEQELARANALLIETRNSAEHNRIYGGHA